MTYQVMSNLHCKTILQNFQIEKLMLIALIENIGAHGRNVFEPY